MNTSTQFNLVDLGFIGYCIWMFISARQRRVSQEILTLIMRIFWILVTLHGYVKIGAIVAPRFSFLPVSMIASASFLFLAVVGGLIISTATNMAVVFLKPQGEDAPQALLVGCIRVVRGIIIYSFIVYFLTLTNVKSLISAAVSSVYFSTPLKGVAVVLYDKVCWVGSKFSPFMNPEQEVVRYVAERNVPADRGSGDGQRSPAEGSHK